MLCSVFLLRCMVNSKRSPHLKRLMTNFHANFIERCSHQNSEFEIAG